jgi:hypothetical protein
MLFLSRWERFFATSFLTLALTGYDPYVAPYPTKI